MNKIGFNGILQQENPATYGSKLCKQLFVLYLQTIEDQEMEEMVEVAKVLVLEEHSHLFTIQPVSISDKHCNFE